MYTATAILIVIASILLTLVVLVQNSKGGGLAANFATGNTTFGVRQTADFLEKATSRDAPVPYRNTGHPAHPHRIINNTVIQTV